MTEPSTEKPKLSPERQHQAHVESVLATYEKQFEEQAEKLHKNPDATSPQHTAALLHAINLLREERDRLRR